MSKPKVVLHWLEASRSHRVIWLLEELDIPYEVKLYKRTKEYRAPKELKALHPLGKSPLIEVIHDDGNKEIVAESGHIFSYLLRHYDTNNKLKKDNETVDYFLHFTEGSFQGLQVSLLINDIAVQKSPFLARYLVKSILGMINSQFYIPESIKIYDYLEELMKKQHANGSQVIVGDSLTAADIMLSFPVNNMFDRPDFVSRVFGKLNVKERYPNIYKWNQYMQSHPNLLKANEVITNLGAKL